MNDYVKNTCKIGQGKDCCRFLVMGGDGFECAKLGSLAKMLIARGNRMAAQADNCEGKEIDQSIKDLNDK